MCVGPELALSAALMGGGKFLETQQANRSARAQGAARDAALAQEMQRQRSYQQQADQIKATSTDRFAPGQQQQLQQSNEADIRQRLQSAVAAPGVMAPDGVGSAPKIVQDTLMRERTDAANDSGTRAANLARLNSFGRTFFDNQMTNARTSQGLGVVGNFAGNSANVNQAEQQQAFNNAAKGPSVLGGLMSAAGKAGMYNDFSGGGLFGTTTQGGPLPWNPTKNFEPAYDPWGLLR